jgi:hypothetical protein
MESRIESIKIQFKKEHNLFLDNFAPSVEVKPKETEEKVKEQKIIPSRTPLALNKIMKHRRELEKNNLKRAQKVVECSGSIEEYEKSLGLKPN